MLVYAGAVLSARDALFWFGHIRGGTRAGVTIPSQIRWIAMLPGLRMWEKGVNNPGPLFLGGGSLGDDLEVPVKS